MRSEKDRARAAVAWAVKTGKLIRPSECSRCLASGKTSDGRSYIHAHHHAGYSNPLDVEWLCPKCHFVDDPRPSMESNGRAKLSVADVVDIRKRYVKGKNRYYSEGSMRALAREFGVDQATIRRVIRRINWIDAALK